MVKELVRDERWEIVEPLLLGNRSNSKVSLLFYGRLRPGMSIRTQIARDFKGGEHNEDYEHQCGEGDRAEARSDEGERYTSRRTQCLLHVVVRWV